jgi:hypothetical protein
MILRTYRERQVSAYTGKTRNETIALKMHFQTVLRIRIRDEHQGSYYHISKNSLG